MIMAIGNRVRDALLHETARAPIMALLDPHTYYSCVHQFILTVNLVPSFNHPCSDGALEYHKRKVIYR